MPLQSGQTVRCAEKSNSCLTVGAGGGLTTLDNLQIIQWQANASKKDHLEFVVPWWELQIGVSVAQLIRLVSSVDSSIRTATLQTMFTEGTNEKLVQDFRLHPQGRTKMIAMAVQGVYSTRSRKDDLINASELILRLLPGVMSSVTCFTMSYGREHNFFFLAEHFWNQPGKVEALKSAVAVYGQSWVKIKESCLELHDLQTSQLKDKVSSTADVHAVGVMYDHTVLNTGDTKLDTRWYA